MKKILLIVILILIVASCLFPPWRRIYREHNSNIKKYEPLGYGFIFDPPIFQVYGERYKDVKADTIDFDRLGLQLGLLVFLGCCIVFSKYIFTQTQSKPKSAPSDEPPSPKNHKLIENTLVFICILVVFGYGVFVTMVYLYTENRCSKLREDNNWLEAQLRKKEYYSSEQRSPEQKKAINTAYEELMADLDSEYGAQYRDEAIKLFSQLAAAGRIPKGKPAIATRIMERCYKEAKATQQQPHYVSRINREFLDSLLADEDAEVQENKPEKTRGINIELLDSLEANGHPEAQENTVGFSLQSYYNIDGFDDGLQIDAYGPGIHMNRYGQPVILRPDFGSVPGEYLHIQPDAYGPGIHKDQYGRPVREYPYP